LRVFKLSKKKNPVKQIKFYKENNKRLRYLEPEEINRLLQECSEHLRPIVILALNTGMRLGEILNLKWRDIDLDQKLIYIIHTKSGEKREVPLNNLLVKLLEKMKKTSENNDYVFSHKNGLPYNRVYKGFKSACKRANIEDFRFHDLRHTFASHLVMNGVDLKTVQELLGHKTFTMTLRYAHLSPDHKRKAVDIIDNKMQNIVTIWSQEQKLENSRVAKNIKE